MQHSLRSQQNAIQKLHSGVRDLTLDTEREFSKIDPEFREHFDSVSEVSSDIEAVGSHAESSIARRAYQVWP